MSRPIFIVLMSFVALHSIGQQYTFKATSPAVRATMQKAVENSHKFIEHTVSPDLFEKHFQLITSLSTVKSEYASFHYTPYMDDTISFIPSKYELRYLITIEDDTLTDSFVIPVDSVGNPDIDTSNSHYILEDLKAYHKLFSGQLKFDYKDVKEFLKAKGLKGYSIHLQNSVERIGRTEYKRMKPYKFYWFVYRYYPNFEIEYVIDPETGKYFKNKRKLRHAA